MNKLLLILIFFSICLKADSQVDSSFNEVFRSPVNYKIRLSGSFGELRKNHFHTGIDIKGKNSTAGDRVVSVMSGQISRIRIQSGSYGKCLYIDHPNGMTSVYAHLDDFSPKIKKLVEQKQKKTKSFELDWYPASDKLKIKQGEFLGYLGNTGRSYGPHLHFELRDTETELAINPLYFDFGISDRKAPFISQIMIHELDSNFQILNKQILSSNQTVAKTAGDLIGIGFKGFDQMDGSSNYNGIVSMKLYKDNKLVYESKFDTISFDEFRYINACIDYEEKFLRNSTYYLCYKQPNNQLKNLKKTVNNGIFELRDTSNVKIVVRDLAGNRSVKELNLIKSDSSQRSKPIKKKKVVDTHKSSGKANVFVPSKSLYRPQEVFFNYDSVNQKLRIGKNEMPCHSYYYLSIQGCNADENLQLYHIDDEGERTNLGGHMKQDTFSCALNRFGKFELRVDRKKPSIKFLNKTENYIKFLLKDETNVSGSAEGLFLSVLADGEWIPFYYKDLVKHLQVDLDQVKNANSLLIMATDRSGNKTFLDFSL